MTYSCRVRKALRVDIKGRIKTQSDLGDLRSKIFSACPDVLNDCLYWNMTVDESGAAYDNECDTRVAQD